ncbi:Tat pathway signal sequence domain protein [Cordyceps fumosorosea ARSEF 2679]|uniref:Tat pathway signal sequence domain protein n=1 Tax=Cordyceps fumosorosea (strain ARSEF 2679) TaxID=1081104 RepID=A0A167PBW1_CORFA|nr:Tat pathway signal sequence domain protein [Cordyceps fumosorosea ARSEF 2679]OAA56502.1 Tat pathway signal sequence domain protein [Cordyceps fumosorosea ARSEF 2679]
MRIVAAVLAAALGISAAVSTPHLQYIDLPLANANGESKGGVNPELPYDSFVLEQALSSARAVQLSPARYKALLWQHWIVNATSEANISLKEWDPWRTAKQNQAVVFGVYEYYAKLYLAHPEQLRWMAFANMAGSAFAAGMLDLGGLPGGGWFASMLMAMQKHIFMDIATMHVAYINGGMAAVEEMRDAGLIDPETAAAWANPPGAVLRFSYREQNLVIPEQWNRVRSHAAPLGEIITYGMTITGPMPVPGAKTPAEYKKLLCGPLPAFNYADQSARWDLLANDTVPAYLRLEPPTVKSIVGESFAERVDQYRTAHRLVDVVLAQLKAIGCRP